MNRVIADPAAADPAVADVSGNCQAGSSALPDDGASLEAMTISKRMTMAAAAMGGGALIALGAFAVDTGITPAPPASAAGVMQLGGTVTSTTPATTLATEFASPEDKAPPFGKRR